MLVLGEVGGFEESSVIEAVRSGAIRKVYVPILSSNYPCSTVRRPLAYLQKVMSVHHILKAPESY